MKYNLLYLSGIVIMVLSCNQNKEQNSIMKYPTTAKVDAVDHYFGEAVADPYRWLENDTSEQTAEWVKAQNDVTFAYLRNIPYRDKIKKRLEQLFNYER